MPENNSCNNPCTDQKPQHKIRFMDDDSSGPCIFYSTKDLHEIQKGVTLAGIFKVTEDPEYGISHDESQTHFVRFVGKHIYSGTLHNFIAEHITDRPAFQFTP